MDRNPVVRLSRDRFDEVSDFIVHYDKHDNANLHDALIKVDELMRKHMGTPQYRSVALWILPRRAFLSNNCLLDYDSPMHEIIITIIGELDWDRASLVAITLEDAKQAMNLIHHALPSASYELIRTNHHDDYIPNCPFDSETLSSGKVVSLSSVILDRDDAKALLPSTKLDFQCHFAPGAGAEYISKAIEIGCHESITTSMFLAQEDFVQ